MILWHVGGAVAIVRYTFRDERMDLRYLVLGALLADLVDTPAGLLLYSHLHSLRLTGHSLLAAAVVMVVVMVRTRRGRPRKRWMPVAVGMLLHLFLDAMWQDPATLWWPFLGLDFAPAGPATATAAVTEVLGDWRVWVLEAVGLLYLAVLGRRAGLAHSGPRHRLWTTGTIDVPIGKP